MQLTGRVWSQVTLYHPHSLCVPSHFVTCASFLLTIWEGLSVCRECALRTQRCKPQTKWVVLNSDSSHSSHITNLKFHNTGSPHRVVHTPLRLPLSLPLVPASCGGQAPSHRLLLLAALKKLSRDLITPLRDDSCLDPATHTRPKAKTATFQRPNKSNCHVIH